MMSNRHPRVFLTGATGFLGHYVLARLLIHSDLSCRLLVSGPLDEAAGRLAALLDPLGIELEAHLSTGRIELVAGRLPERIDPSALNGVQQIIHMAASTNFLQRGLEPYRSNVDGTQALLDLALTAGVRRFCLVSTAYAGGLRTGAVPEAVLDSPSAQANDYERSKCLAEKAVMDWAGHGRIATIVRPSILVGDRQTGRATTFGGIYLLARSVELMARAVAEDRNANRYAVPLRIMGSPDVRPNLIPVCWAAKRLVQIALDDPTESRTYNVVNPAPPTSAQIKQWLETFFDLGGGEFTDMTWPWEDPSRYEEGFYSAGQPILDYFLRDLAFDCRNPALDLLEGPLVDEAYFLDCLRFAVRAGWGRAARPLPATSPRGLDPAWYFEDYLVHNLPRSRASRVAGLSAVVRFIIEGSCGGEWACRYVAGRLVEIRRRADSLREQFGFRVQQGAFEKIVRGESRLQDAYFAGKANIFGDILAALKMVPIMERFLQEFPVGLVV